MVTKLNYKFFACRHKLWPEPNVVSNIYTEIKLIVMSSIKDMGMANIGYKRSQCHGISIGRASLSFHFLFQKDN